MVYMYMFVHSQFSFNIEDLCFVCNIQLIAIFPLIYVANTMLATSLSLFGQFRSAVFTRPKSCNLYKLNARDFKGSLETLQVDKCVQDLRPPCFRVASSTRMGLK